MSLLKYFKGKAKTGHLRENGWMNLDVGQDCFSLKTPWWRPQEFIRVTEIKGSGDTRVYKGMDCSEFGAAEEQNKGTPVYTKWGKERGVGGSVEVGWGQTMLYIPNTDIFNKTEHEEFSSSLILRSPWIILCLPCFLETFSVCFKLSLKVQDPWASFLKACIPQPVTDLLICQSCSWFLHSNGLRLDLFYFTSFEFWGRVHWMKYVLK